MKNTGRFEPDEIQSKIPIESNRGLRNLPKMRSLDKPPSGVIVTFT